MDIELVKVFANSDPITGQNVEAVIRLTANDQRNIKTVKEKLSKVLPAHMIPRRIKISEIKIGHRY